MMDAMSDTPRWNNLPVPSESSGVGGDWSGFTADPRTNPGLRASDADRSRASSLVSAAYADGRLNRDEFDQRISQAASARELGELVPVLGDLMVPATTTAPSVYPPAAAAAAPVTPPAAGTFGLRGLLGKMPAWWLGMAMMFNAIWLMTVLGSGHLIYYWPMWPMFGTAIPVVIAMMTGKPINQRRAARDEFRAQRRAFRRGELPPRQLPSQQLPPQQLPPREDLR